MCCWVHQCLKVILVYTLDTTSFEKWYISLLYTLVMHISLVPVCLLRNWLPFGKQQIFYQETRKPSESDRAALWVSGDIIWQMLFWAWKRSLLIPIISERSLYSWNSSVLKDGFLTPPEQGLIQFLQGSCLPTSFLCSWSLTWERLTSCCPQSQSV